jgi:hypothetical protein
MSRIPQAFSDAAAQHSSMDWNNRLGSGRTGRSPCVRDAARSLASASGSRVQNKRRRPMHIFALSSILVPFQDRSGGDVPGVSSVR